MLNPYSLNLEQKNFLIERIGDLITKQCLMEAREVTPTPLIWQEEPGHPSNNEPSPKPENFSLKLEDKYREAIYYLFTRS